jgi:hypothetical protein
MAVRPPDRRVGLTGRPSRPESPHVDDPPSDSTTDTDAPEWAAPVGESGEEPIGDQVAQPSDEAVEPAAARGPRLPDRWPAFVFFLLGAVTAWVSYLEVSTTAWTPESVASFALSLLPPVCSVLLPGALLLRHPEAPRRARTLLFGTLLFAAVPFFNAIEGSLRWPSSTTDSRRFWWSSACSISPWAFRGHAVGRSRGAPG